MGIPLDEFSNTHNGQPLCYVGLGAKKSYNSLTDGHNDSSSGGYTTPFSEKLLVDAFRKAGKRLDMGNCCHARITSDKDALGDASASYASLSRVPLTSVLQ